VFARRVFGVQGVERFGVKSSTRGIRGFAAELNPDQLRALQSDQNVMCVEPHRRSSHR
jgi:hypothetical protein